jgi:hypothetical protein
MIVRNAKCIIDTRNATKNVRAGRKHVAVLGGGTD